MAQESDTIQEIRNVIASVKFALEQERELGFETLAVPASAAATVPDVVQQEADDLFAAAPDSLPQDPRSQMAMADLKTDALACERCDLCRTRQNVVFGAGSEQADLVFVGEAPGADEDRQGEPFVGRAGQLLTNIIQAMKLERNDVYILNVLKCRPPQNRNPQPFEIEQCSPYLQRQLECIRPKAICALGTFAVQTLLRTTEPISRLRGRFHTYQGIPLMPTYHPAYLLRNPAGKRQVWEDIQKIQARLEGR